MSISQTQSDILCASFFNTADKMTNSTMDTDCMANMLYKTWPEPHDVTLQAIKYCKDRQQTVKGAQQIVLDSMQY